jgi:hypothetical protein
MLFIVQHFSDVSMAVFTCAKDLQQHLPLFSPPPTHTHTHIYIYIYIFGKN